MTPPTLDELLALDASCLTEPSGAPLDLPRHRTRLAASMDRASFTTVRRESLLVACAYIWPLRLDDWFVGGLAIHPDHRNASVISELFSSFARMVRESGARSLHSHVLANNARSIRLHRRMGFAEVLRNEHAVAFAVDADNITSLEHRLARSPTAMQLTKVRNAT